MTPGRILSRSFTADSCIDLFLFHFYLADWIERKTKNEEKKNAAQADGVMEKIIDLLESDKVARNIHR